MNDLYDQVREEVEALIEQGKQAVADGLSWAEGWALLNRTYEAVIGIVDRIQASNVAKKALALQLIDRYYAEVVAPIDIPYVPDWLEKPVIDPAIGQAVHVIADRAFDEIIRRLKEKGD